MAAFTANVSQKFENLQVSNEEKQHDQLYSRQLYVLGKDAQKLLENSNVLVTGNLNGVAAEVAKNVVLAGVKSLTLHDDCPCTVGDLASNFFVHPTDVVDSNKRAAVLARRVSELNSHVTVSVVEGDLTFENNCAQSYGNYSVIVAVNMMRDELEQLSQYCYTHSPAIPFICTGMYGLYGYAFSSFGPEWEVVDLDGETLKSGLVVNIRTDENGRILVETSDDKHHGLSQDSFVKFTGVQGMNRINNETFKVLDVAVEQVDGDGNSRLVHGVQFAIAPMSGESFEMDKEAIATFGDYQGGGYFEQVKLPQTLRFVSLTDGISKPDIVMNRWEDPGRPERLHALLLALWQFEREENQLPEPHNQQQAERIVKYAQQYSLNSNEKWNSDQIEAMTKLAKVLCGQLNPMSSFLGGVVGQEILKASSKKFTPLSQWLHFDAVECLSMETPLGPFPSYEQLQSTSVPLVDVERCRYYGQEAVFGSKFQSKLGKLKMFLVGSGALGCEFLKNFAVTGCCTASRDGQLTVTDMDAIETSNLSRQFLFRESHVGKLKSVVASTAAEGINSDLHVKALQDKVSPETEDRFGDLFWDPLDVVVNALDNVAARVYVDSRCLYYGKPLLESGTLGSKSNTLPIVPHITESYSSDSVKDDENQGIPACTLHAYPNLIEHTLAWARDSLFEKYFSLDPKEALHFLESCQHGSNGLASYRNELARQANTKLARLRTVKTVVSGIEPDDHTEHLFPYTITTNNDEGPLLSVSKCIYFARCRFEEHFVNRIVQLLTVHPLDKMVGEVGNQAPFWSGSRRPPKVEPFDPSDPLHFNFIASCSRLYAAIYQADPMGKLSDNDFIMSELSKFDPLPEFHATSEVRIPENDEEAKKLKEQQAKESEANLETLDVQSNNMLDQLWEEYANKSRVVVPLTFEKDDDSNSHIDFITAAANLRARNYQIPEIDRLKAKQIVGRIIPAIATTTAMTTGLAMFELYKLVQGCASVEMYTSANINLAVNSHALFKPTACPTKVFGKTEDTCTKYTMWTQITLEGDLTMQEVIDEIAEKYNFEVMSIGTTGEVNLYNDMFAHTQGDRLEKPVAEVYREVVGEEPPAVYIPLLLDGEFELESDDDEDSVEDEDIMLPNFRLKWNV